MGTKIVAARLGMLAGVTTIITRSSNPGNILGIVRYLTTPRTPSSSTSSESGDHAADHITQKTVSLNLSDASTHFDETEAPPLHTRFLPSSDPIQDRYFWLLHTPNPHGTVYIDAGCHRALIDKAGLLPVGVVDVEGHFAQSEVVRLVVVERRASSPGPDGKRWEASPRRLAAS